MCECPTLQVRNNKPWAEEDCWQFVATGREGRAHGTPHTRACCSSHLPAEVVRDRQGHSSSTSPRAISDSTTSQLNVTYSGMGQDTKGLLVVLLGSRVAARRRLLLDLVDDGGHDEVVGDLCGGWGTRVWGKR